MGEPAAGSASFSPTNFSPGVGWPRSWRRPLPTGPRPRGPGCACRTAPTSGTSGDLQHDLRPRAGCRASSQSSSRVSTRDVAQRDRDGHRLPLRELTRTPPRPGPTGDRRRSGTGSRSGCARRGAASRHRCGSGAPGRAARRCARRRRRLEPGSTPRASRTRSRIDRRWAIASACGVGQHAERECGPAYAGCERRRRRLPR